MLEKKNRFAGAAPGAFGTQHSSHIYQPTGASLGDLNRPTGASPANPPCPPGRGITVMPRGRPGWGVTGDYVMNTLV